MRTFCILALACAISTGATAGPYTFTHIAGASGGAGAVDANGMAARFNAPGGVALVGGTLYVTDTLNHTIRIVTLSTGKVTTLAGLDTCGGTLDGGRSAARLGSPAGIARDAAGNLYFAEPTGSVIRKVTPTGVVSTYAGKVYESGSADGTLAFARFNDPNDVAVDADGNVYVADSGNHTIRKITPAGMVSTVAGLAGMPGSANGNGATARFNDPSGIAVDGDGFLYVADAMNHTVRKITPAGDVTTIAGLAGTSGTVDGDGSAARFDTPRDVAVGADGTMFVADTMNRTIRKITPPDSVLTYAGLPHESGWVDDVWILARFAQPLSITVDDSDGSIYVADSSNCAIRKVTTDFMVSTVAGAAATWGTANGDGSAARFCSPSDVVFDSHSWLFVADSCNHAIRKISGGAATVSTFAGRVGSPGSTDARGGSARFYDPTAIAIDGTDNLYVADRSNHTIRKIEPDGDVTTLAGSPGIPGTANGTGSAARFDHPSGIAWHANFVYVADSDNHTIRKVSSTGVVTTFAGAAGESGSADGGATARFNVPRGIGVDDDGNLYVADVMNHTIRKITPSGTVSTIAGTAGAHGDDDGTGAEARFSYPYGIAVDDRADGVYLFVTDGNELVRMIAPGNVVTTIGGLSDRRGAADGTGTLARLNQPRGIDLLNDALFFADSGNHCIRRGSPALATVATIDDDSGPMSVVRQLGASPAATTYLWSVVRRPAGSTASPSSSVVRNPTFTADRPDVYRFRLIAATGGPQSITEVTFTAECPTVTISPASLVPAQLGDAYSVTFSASGGHAPYVFDLEDGVLPSGMTLSGGTLSGTPGNVGAFPISVRAYDNYACNGVRDYTLNVISLDPPTGLTATAVGSTSVSLAWSASAGASGYRIYRGTTLTSTALVGSTAALTYSDASVDAGRSYIYKVRAYDSSSNESDDSNADFATTVAYTDPTLAGATVKAVHISQLRTAVNAFRVLAGFAPYGFSPIAVGNTALAEHVQSLRSALDSALDAAGIPVAYADDPLAAGVAIKAVHLTELRNAMK